MPALELHVAERMGLNLTLQPGTQQQTVEVTAESAPPLQTEDASTGQVFTTQQINDTPLNGRNWVFIAQLSAGVAASNGSRGQGMAILSLTEPALPKTTLSSTA